MSSTPLPECHWCIPLQVLGDDNPCKKSRAIHKKCDVKSAQYFAYVPIVQECRPTGNVPPECHKKPRCAIPIVCTGLCGIGPVGPPPCEMKAVYPN